jgi:hypothetical protein
MVIDINFYRAAVRRFWYSCLLLALFLAATMPAISADDRKTGTIDAIAIGTSTQVVKMSALR